jgi:subtilase family serine protease
VSFGGTAAKGTDYVTPSTTVTIPAGAASVDVPVTPVDDLQVENNETVVLTLRTGSGYTVGTPSSGTVTIVSDDTAPDFTVTALGAPSVGAAGQAVAVTDTIKNQGSGESVASKTWFYLSANTVLDASDTLLGTRDVPALTVGASSSGTSSVTLPAATSAGLFYLLAVADGPGEIVETNESNNRRSTSIRIGPDLVVSALSAPSTAAAGTSISVADTTKNQGGGSSDASVTRLYLSSNYALDAGDTALQSRAVPALGPGESSAGTTTATIPAGTPTGTYYLIARADDGEAVGESSDTNNTKWTTVRVGADLQVSALSAPLRVAGGTAIVVTDTTKNAGAGMAEASMTAFYLSSNAALDSSDVRLTPARAVGPLAAGATSSASTSVAVPDVAPGLWYLVARADDGEAVDEIFENNNTRAVSMHVGPDLDVTAVSAPLSAVAGASVSVSDTVKNLGAATAPPSVTTFYLSLNTVLDASDLLLNGQRAVPSLAQNATSSGSTVLTLPAGVSGVYYILAVADGPGSIAESSETNNTAYRKITINP